MNKSQVARAARVPPTVYGYLESGELSPVTSENWTHGPPDWRADAQKLSSYWGIELDELFPDAMPRQTWHLDRRAPDALAPTSGWTSGRPDVELERKAEVMAMRAAIAGLDHPGAGVILRRMRGETLASIGARLGVTRERVRQIEARAHRRLRRAIVAILGDAPHWR